MMTSGGGVGALVVLAVLATWKAGVFGGVQTTAIGLLCLAVMLPLLSEVVAVVTTGVHNKKNNSGSAIEGRRARRDNPPAFEGVVVAAVVAFIWGAIYAHWSGLVMHDNVYEVLLLHALPSMWINSSMFVHLYMAATTSPGLPPRSTASAAGVLQRCNRCDALQFPGTHHCKTCKRCCLGMDHHCPFTANCVGKDNYRHFFAFVLWAWVATIYAIWLTRLPSTYCSQPGVKTAGCAALSRATGSLFLASVASCAALSALLGLIVYLLSTKQSTRNFIMGRTQDKATMNSTTLDFVVSRLGPAREWWRYCIPWGLLVTAPFTRVNSGKVN